MFIQCPQCRTHNEVSESLLQHHEEVITCRHCRHRFTLTLTPASEEETTVLPAEEEAPREATQPAININVSREELSRLAGGTATAKRTAPVLSPHTAGWSAGVALMVLLFIGQFSYFERADLARHVSLRPWLAFVCGLAGCDVPLLRDPARIRIAARHVADHPRARDALLVTLTMVNDASFPQPFPRLELSFKDLDDRVIAQRVFEPAQYLPAGVDVRQGMAPGTPVMATLALVDPGPEAVNFEFRMR
ncbi:MAG TPA: DUF3426 domain-containing protein [Gammaproteobacteria bacterium]|nr:DUF3426 domain-containing protein [Gammaproteobacteria bacterium]